MTFQIAILCAALQAAAPNSTATCTSCGPQLTRIAAASCRQAKGLQIDTHPGISLIQEGGSDAAACALALVTSGWRASGVPWPDGCGEPPRRPWWAFDVAAYLTPRQARQAARLILPQLREEADVVAFVHVGDWLWAWKDDSAHHPALSWLEATPDAKTAAVLAEHLALWGTSEKTLRSQVDKWRGASGCLPSCANRWDRARAVAKRDVKAMLDIAGHSGSSDMYAVMIQLGYRRNLERALKAIPAGESLPISMVLQESGSLETYLLYPSPHRKPPRAQVR